MPQPRLPELTPRAVVLGLALSVVMGAANVYLGLKAGMTVSASIPAAVMARLILRPSDRGSSMLEANQVQTTASAGESLAAGIIFTMPALVMIGYWQSFEYATVTLVALTGGLLGVLFMIPMRRVFIVNNPDLPYPEGIACAAVLRAGQDRAEANGRPSIKSDPEARPLIIGGLVGALFKLLTGFFGIVKGSVETAFFAAGPGAASRVFFLGADISPMLVAVGLIVRLNVAVLLFLGGALAWLIAIPILGVQGAPSTDPIEAAVHVWSTQVRYIGVGAMVVGGVSSIFNVRQGLEAAIAELGQHFRFDRKKRSRSEDSPGRPLDETDRDLPSLVIVGLIAFSVVLLVGVYYSFTQSVGITLLTTLVMFLASFFFTAVASYIVGLVGNSNSPVSGMTITAVLLTGGLLYLAGYSGLNGMVATLGVAAVVCCVACTAGDTCNDLKAGSLLGAAPFRQQIMQMLGIAVAALAMSPVLQLLHENTPGQIGGRNLPAPQASLFASLARGFAGEGHLPWDMVAIGLGVGIVILAVDAGLRRMKSGFRAHLMPIAVGIYLPFGISVPILAGGLIAHFATRRMPPQQADTSLHRGILFGSGTIAGESLMGVGLAGLTALGLQRYRGQFPDWLVNTTTLLLAIFGLFLFVRYSRQKSG